MPSRTGFTLIELLIVVVIIGILAAIAIPKFASSKERAHLTAMKSDLRNLATIQEMYLSDFGTYSPVTASNLADAVPTPDPATGFVPSSNVTITAAVVAGGAGWNATATHVNVPGRSCEIYIAGGQVTGPSGLTNVEGEPTCN